MGRTAAATKPAIDHRADHAADLAEDRRDAGRVGVFTVEQPIEPDALPWQATPFDGTPGVVAVPLDALAIHPDNVRRTGRKAKVDDLVASIAARGLLQNLLVVADPHKPDHWLVKAGGRRLRALQVLAKAGTIAADVAVPVRVLGDGDHAAEASLAENLHRLALNPADEILAFKAFVDAGESEADIASRFGVTARHVAGRLRLAGLHEKIMGGLRDGTVSLDCAMAFGSVDDVELQAAVLKNAKSSHGGMTPDSIRRMMREKGVPPTSSRAVLVGRDAYLAAGGRIATDLFTDEATELWTDTALVERLAGEALHAGAVALQAKFRFGKMMLSATTWGSPSREDIDGLTPYGPVLDWTQLPEGQRSQLAVSAMISSEGKVALYREAWLIGAEMIVAPEAERMPAKPEPDDDARDFPGGVDRDAEDGMPAAPVQKIVPPPAPPPPEDNSPALSQRMADELAMRRRDVLRLCLADNYSVAADVAAFLLADRLVGVQSSYGIKLHGTAITANDLAEPISGVRWTDELGEHLVDQRDSLPGDWAAEADPVKRFAAFRALQPAQRTAWLAWATAASLTAWENKYQRTPAKLHDAIGVLLEVKPATYWRPTAANYFDRVGKPLCLAMIAQVEGEAAATKLKNAKKPVLAERCEQLAAGDLGDKAVQLAGLQWLPPQMMFGGAK